MDLFNNFASEVTKEGNDIEYNTAKTKLRELVIGVESKDQGICTSLLSLLCYTQTTKKPVTGVNNIRDILNYVSHNSSESVKQELYALFPKMQNYIETRINRATAPSLESGADDPPSYKIATKGAVARSVSTSFSQIETSQIHQQQVDMR